MPNKIYTLKNGLKVIRKIHKSGDPSSNAIKVCGNCDFEIGKYCPLEFETTPLCYRSLKFPALCSWSYYLKIVKTKVPK